MQSDVQCQYFMSLRSYVGKGRNLSFRACEPTTNSPFQGPELPSEGSRLGVSCDNYKREFIGNPEKRAKGALQSDEPQSAEPRQLHCRIHDADAFVQAGGCLLSNPHR